MVEKGVSVLGFQGLLRRIVEEEWKERRSNDAQFIRPLDLDEQRSRNIQTLRYLRYSSIMYLMYESA